MVEDHRSQTDLSPATTVVLSLHSSEHRAHCSQGFWRRDAVTQESSRSVDLLQPQRESTPHVKRPKVRSSVLLLEPLAGWILFSGVSKHFEVWSRKQSLNLKWRMWRVAAQSSKGIPNLLIPGLDKLHIVISHNMWSIVCPAKFIV